MKVFNNAIGLVVILLLYVIETKAETKPVNIGVGIHTAYSPYCNINNELSLYYTSQSVPYQTQYIVRSKLNVYDVGAFVDLKYLRFNFYRTKCISSSNASSASNQVFKNNTYTAFYRQYENGSIVNEEIYKAEYVSAGYKAVSGSFHLKYPVKEVFFPFAGLGFSNISRMDLDGNGIDDYTYGIPSQRIGILGSDSTGAVNGRTKKLAFVSLGIGVIKHINEFSVELLWQMDFGIDGRKPYTTAYKDYYETLYTSTTQNAELVGKSTGYYKMTIGLTFAYNFSVELKRKKTDTKQAQQL